MTVLPTKNILKVWHYSSHCCVWTK